MNIKDAAQHLHNATKRIRELEQQRAELLEALKDSLVVIAGISSDKEQDVLRIRAAITKAEAAE